MTGHKFRLSHKEIVGELSVILFAIYGLGVALCLAMVVCISMLSGKFSALTSVFPIIFGFPALIIAIIAIALIIMPFGRAIFSYLMLSDDGLDYRLWPLHRIRCTWDDVEQIKKSSISPFKGDILILKRADVSGFHLLLNFRQGKFGFTETIPQVPLYNIEG
jgi:hypothetical protein